MKKLLLLFTVFAILVTGSLTVNAGQLEDYQTQSKNVANSINNTKNKLNNARDQKNRLENEAYNLETEEERQRRYLEQMQSDLDIISSEIIKVSDELTRSEQEYQDRLDNLKIRLRVMYEYSTASLLDILFESKNILDFFERLDLMASITKENERLIEEIQVLKRDIEYKKYVKEMTMTDLQVMSVSQNERIDNIVASRGDLSREIQNQNAYIKQIEKELKEEEELSYRISQMIKELQSNQKYAGGTMEWPLPNDYSVHSAFGMRLHPILKVMKMHTGVDIGGKYGASIVAANSGTVISAGWNGGYGYCVIIDHGMKDNKSITTLYGHCSKLLVKKGDKVSKGQAIANVGSTGNSTGPHLHFEVRENGDPVNPINGSYLIKK